MLRAIGALIFLSRTEFPSVGGGGTKCRGVVILKGQRTGTNYDRGWRFGGVAKIENQMIKVTMGMISHLKKFTKKHKNLCRIKRSESRKNLGKNVQKNMPKKNGGLDSA